MPPLVGRGRTDYHFLLAILLTALMGVLYGTLVQPLWSEAVEFGQVWAGTVRYEPTNPWYVAIVATPSLQITIPALMLLAGIEPWHVSLATTAFFCAAAFSSIGAATFAFSRNWYLSICTPLLLLTYNFYDAHGYGVVYPMSYWQFGQTGQHVALLGLAFAACGWPLAAGLVGGMLAGVHAVWCGAFVLGAFSITALLDRHQLKRLIPAFAISMLIGIFLQVFGEWNMPPKHQYTPPPIPAGATEAPNAPVVLAASNRLGEASKTMVGEAASFEANQKAEVPIAQKKRKTFQGHNVLFADDPFPLQRAILFFLPDAVLVILLGAFFFTVHGFPAAVEGHYRSAYRLAAMAAVPIGAATLFKLAEEFDPDFTLLALINGQLPSLLLRAILTRWLNLSILLVPIVVFALLTILVRERRSWLAAAGLVAFLLIISFIESRWFLVPDAVSKSWISFGYILPLTILISLIVAAKFDDPRAESGPVLSRVIGAVLAFVFVAKFATLSVQAYSEQRFRGSDAADPLVAAAKRDSGMLIVSPGVVAIRRFNPQLRTGRAIVVPTALDVYDAEARKVIQVFCYANPSQSFDEFYASVRPCFEDRSPHEWSVIRRETKATGLITPDNWTLNIRPTITAGGFAYYRLPMDDDKQSQ